MLKLDDIEQARAHFLSTIPNAFGFFETVDQSCMEASGATAPDLLGRGAILGTMLLACGEKPARRAFDMQVQRFGGTWLHQFFGGVASFLRERIPTADDRLVKAYASAAVRLGAKLAITDLLKAPDVQALLRECFGCLMTGDAVDVLAAPLSAKVSEHIAAARGIPKPDLSKVTEQEMRNFLTWLPAQVLLVFTTAKASA
jgi:hypothetical protein